MCGIVFLLSKQETSFETLKRMTDTLYHRGPNDEGYLFTQSTPDTSAHEKCIVKHSSSGISMGHRRLSIVDLSVNGRQPMNYQDRYWIVFNGEIYNYLEIKEELIKLGYSFQTGTDTEVIMAAYDAWGPDCQTKFNGMWAFVIWDEKTNTIFISRDRFGIKPLYYFQNQDHIIFASEIKAILAHPAVVTEANIEYCKSFLKQGSLDHLHETAFKHVFRFPRACYVKTTSSRLFEEIQPKHYWELKPNLALPPFSEEKAREYAKTYETLLEDAVRLRLRADVKTGSALSGGLDSASVVYHVNKALKEQNKSEKQETFSCVYPSPETQHCDESQYINELAKNLQVKSNQIQPKTEDIITEFQKFAYILDTPATDTLMSSWHTYKLIQECGVTVTLDGQGADEQLGGYKIYILYYFTTLPIQNWIQEGFRFLKMPDVKKRILQGLILNASSKIIGKRRTLQLLKKATGKSDIFIPFNEKLQNDFSEVLETLFHFADRGSMAFSIESRMPFMDYRLVEFLASVPANYKLHNGWTKYIARKAMNQKLPDSITWRKDKMGWPIPQDYWFKGPLKDTFLKTLRESSILKMMGYQFSRESDSKILKANRLPLLLKCYSLATWDAIFFPNREPTML